MKHVNLILGKMAYLYIDPTSDLKTSTALAEIWEKYD